MAIYDRIKKYFSEAGKTIPQGARVDINLFLSFLIENADVAVYREELLPRVEKFKLKSKDKQEEELPGLYLYIEKYIFKSTDGSVDQFRAGVADNFNALINEHPDFQVIFLPYQQQVNVLCNRFLTLICKRLEQFLGASADTSWGAFSRWLAQHAQQDRSPSVYKVTLTFASQEYYVSDPTLKDYILFSHHFFKDVEKRFNTNFILNHFNEAYEVLAVKFRNLDAFHELIKLFPNKTLDESKLNLLSIQEIKELLLDKVDNLERLSIELQEKNEQLEETNQELNAQSDLLNVQNKRLQEAQNTIERKNRELSDYSLNLERVVEKRTRELETANAILKQYTDNLEEHAFAISHHVKAPVARILGLIYLLNNHPEEIKSGDVLVKLEDSVNELNAILAELVHSLNIKKDASYMVVEPCDLSQLLNLIVIELKEKYRINVTLSLMKQDSGEIKTDYNYLTQALRHILDNSFKFRADQSLKIEASITSSETHTTIFISDNGIGFPFEMVKEKIFSPFQRFNTQYAGKGMGLYFARQLIAVLNGSIQIKSEQGKGTSVLISLPQQTK